MLAIASVYAGFYPITSDGVSLSDSDFEQLIDAANGLLRRPHLTKGSSTGRQSPQTGSLSANSGQKRPAGSAPILAIPSARRGSRNRTFEGVAVRRLIATILADHIGQCVHRSRRRLGRPKWVDTVDRGEALTDSDAVARCQ